MERVKWIEANGKRILYADYSGLKTLDEMVTVMNELMRMANMSPGKVLTMTNFRDATSSSEFMEMIKKGDKEYQEKSEKTAVIGITGLKSVLYQGFLRVSGNKTVKACNTEEEAIAFLVS